MKMEGFTLSSVWTVVTLMVSCVLFLLPLKQRERPWLRVLLFSAVCALVGVLCEQIVPPASLVDLALYYCMSSGFFLCCGKIAVAEAMYCGIWALLTQQLATEVILLVRDFSGRWNPLPAGWMDALGIVLGVALYAAIALTIARWMPYQGRYDVGPRQFVSALFLLVFFELLFNLMFSPAAELDSGQAITLLLVQVYCATVLYLQNELFKKSAMRHELETLDRLWHQQKEQYSLAKENIALINRKCHDLKHQVAAMRTIAGPEEREKYLKEVEDSVRIYEAIVQTGNEVLDTVLTEKSLLCEANQIKVNCVADGRQLTFMDPVDLYTIFGNALDNAIESIKDYQDPGMRFIDVQVYAEQQFLIVHISNPLRGPLTFENVLPVSTKPNNGYHGFGLKSIRHTVEQYEGHLTVKEEDGCFHLRILIPLSGTKSKKSWSE